MTFINNLIKKKIILYYIILLFNNLIFFFFIIFIYFNMYLYITWILSWKIKITLRRVLVRPIIVLDVCGLQVIRSYEFNLKTFR